MWSGKKGLKNGEKGKSDGKSAQAKCDLLVCNRQKFQMQKNLKKLQKKCWQKGYGVIYYVSAAEEAVQNGPWKLNNKQRFKQQRISLINFDKLKKSKRS